MQILPPSTDIEKKVYDILKHDEYWTDKTIKIEKYKTIVVPRYSEGEKGIIYDTFRYIDKHIQIDYSRIDLRKYLKTIQDEVSKNSVTWGLAMQRIVKKCFNKTLYYKELKPTIYYDT